MNIKNNPFILSLWIILTLLLVFFNVYDTILNKHEVKLATLPNLKSGNDDSTLINYMAMLSEVQNSYLENKTFLEIFFDKKKSLLIYRYAQNMCSTCIAEDLSELRNFQSEFGKSKIFILPAYENTRDGKITLMNELEHFNYKNLDAVTLPIPIDSQMLSKRYFAYINNKGNLNMIFFPINGKPELTRAYFSAIAKIYQQELAEQTIFSQANY